MIDISKPHSSLVRVIKNEDETTETFQVGDDIFRGTEDRKKRIQMISRFNPHLCESFYAKKVIIVEGETEAIVFRDLISRFYNKFEIHVINAASKNNIPFFQEIFTAFNIEHCIVHDTDSKINVAAWALNSAIWEKIEFANAKKDGLARRYVHLIDFETAHGISLTGKEKPIKAYEFVGTINEDSDFPCIKFLKDLLIEKKIVHNKQFVEALDT